MKTEDKALASAQSRGNYVTEDSKLIETTGNSFRFFAKSEILLVSLPDFYDRRDERWRVGKTVSVKLRDLVDKPQALKDLLDILNACKDRIDHGCQG